MSSLVLTSRGNMETKTFLEDFIFNFGIKASIVNKTYTQALYESSHFDKMQDFDYIKEIMISLLDLKDRKFVDNFILNSKGSLSEFIDTLMDEEIVSEDMMSTDFAPNQKPENGNHQMHTQMYNIEDEEQEKNNAEAGI